MEKKSEKNVRKTHTFNTRIYRKLELVKIVTKWLLLLPVQLLYGEHMKSRYFYLSIQDTLIH